MAAMTFTEFVKAANERFGVDIRLYKSKAGYEMVDIYMEGKLLCSGSITGPDAGYACHFGSHYAVSIFGWAFTLQHGMWYLLRDGLMDWREGTNPFPEISEEVKTR